jgi:excisionase family DNA binding protein
LGSRINRDWYSVNEVAEILGESYKKIYNLVVSGELGHYRVGRSYRIRKADLGAYFAQQDKQLHPILVQTIDTPEAVVLDKAEAGALRILQSTSAQGYYSGPATASGSVELQEIRSPRLFASESSIRGNVSMAATGDQGNDGRSARQREAEYIGNFQQLFHHGLAVAHPTTDEIIKFDDWSAIEQVEDELLQLGRYLNVSILRPEQQMNFPNNVRVLYWIEPNSLGGILRKYPKEGLVIECATVSRLERLVHAGHDEERMHLSTVEQMLQERHALVQRWSARYGSPIAYLVGLASTTGWDVESIEHVRNLSDNSRIFPYLIDLVDLTVYSSKANQKSADYLELFELPLGERKVKRIQQQIRELLLATGALRLADLQAQLECGQALIREACVQLAKSNPDYSILQEGSSLVIRNS